MDTYSTTQQIDPKLLARTKALWPMCKSILIAAGISFAMAYAACHLIPDQAVMSKEEIEKGEDLSEKELMIRKSAIPAMIYAGASIPGAVKDIFVMSRNPGIQPKLLAFARVLKMTPAFVLAYQILKRRVEDQEPTLNIREIMKDTPISPNTIAGISIAGNVVDYGIPAASIATKWALEDIAAKQMAQQQYTPTQMIYIRNQ